MQLFNELVFILSRKSRVFAFLHLKRGFFVGREVGKKGRQPYSPSPSPPRIINLLAPVMIFNFLSK